MPAAPRRLKAVSWTTAAIVEFIRDTPLLVQLFFLYYVLPDYGMTLPAFLTGALALGLQYSAYTSEVYRGGFDAVPRGQWEAAIALNLSRFRIYRDIVVPQAVPRIMPAMGNYAVSMLKETPVLSVVTVLDMLNLANMIGDRTFEYLVPLSLVGTDLPDHDDALFRRHPRARARAAQSRACPPMTASPDPVHRRHQAVR